MPMWLRRYAVVLLVACLFVMVCWRPVGSESPHVNPHEPYAYLLFVEDGVVYVKSGMSGLVEYSHTDAAMVFEYVESQLHDVGGLVRLQSGVYVFTSVWNYDFSGAITFQGEGRGESYHTRGTTLYLLNVSNVGVINSIRTGWGAPLCRLTFRDLTLYLVKGYVQAVYTLVELHNVNVYQTWHNEYAVKSASIAPPAETVRWTSVSWTTSSNMVNMTGFWLHYEFMTIDGFSANPSAPAGTWVRCLHLTPVQNIVLINADMYANEVSVGMISFLYGHDEVIMIGGRIGNREWLDTTAFMHDGGGTNMTVRLVGTIVGTQHVSNNPNRVTIMEY